MEKRNEKPLIPADQEKTFLYTVARGIGFLTARVFFPVRYHSPEVLDQTAAPYILIANHLSLVDPLLVAYVCKKYEVRFLGKKELANTPIIGRMLKAIHMIPVDRHHNDLSAIRSCSQALQDGRVLGIFPEGTRRHQDLMTPIESGTAVLALRAKVQLLPAYISKKARLFRRTDIYVGQPMDISDLYPNGITQENVNLLTGRIKERFFAMRNEAEKAACQTETHA